MRNPSWPKRWQKRYRTIYYRPTDQERADNGWPGRVRLGAADDLEECYATYYRKIVRGIVVPRTLGDAMSIYLASDRFSDLANSTKRDYRNAIERLREVFGDVPPADWIPAYGYRYLDSEPLVQGNRDIAVLSNVLQVCVRAGVVERNLVKDVQKNKEEARHRYVTDDELAAFLSHCNPKLQAWVELKMLTGLRQGQLRALRLSDWRDGELWVQGTKRGRNNVYRDPVPMRSKPHPETPLSDAVEAAIELYHGKTPRSVFLFCTRSGAQYTADGFRSIWQRAMVKYANAGGERFTEHDLRAKVGSDKEDLQSAQRTLGHLSASTTNRVYVRGPQRIEVVKR